MRKWERLIKEVKRGISKVKALINAQRNSLLETTSDYECGCDFGDCSKCIDKKRKNERIYLAHQKIDYEITVIIDDIGNMLDCAYQDVPFSAPIRQGKKAFWKRFWEIVNNED